MWVWGMCVFCFAPRPQVDHPPGRPRGALRFHDFSKMEDPLPGGETEQLAVVPQPRMRLRSSAARGSDSRSSR